MYFEKKSLNIFARKTQRFIHKKSRNLKIEILTYQI